MGGIADVDVRQIVDDIVSTVLGLEIADADDPGTGTEVLVTGCVHLTGGFDGSVTVECAEPLARQATRAMFMLGEDDEISESDLRDVVGELANMVGGNVKSAVGAERLSLPSVTAGVGARITVPGTELVDRLAFRCAGESLVVAVLARPVAGAASNGQAVGESADR